MITVSRKLVPSVLANTALITTSSYCDKDNKELRIAMLALAKGDLQRFPETFGTLSQEESPKTEKDSFWKVLSNPKQTPTLPKTGLEPLDAIFAKEIQKMVEGARKQLDSPTIRLNVSSELIFKFTNIVDLSQAVLFAKKIVAILVKILEKIGCENIELIDNSMGYYDSRYCIPPHNELFIIQMPNLAYVYNTVKSIKEELQKESSSTGEPESFTPKTHISVRIMDLDEKLVANKISEKLEAEGYEDVEAKHVTLNEPPFSVPLSFIGISIKNPNYEADQKKCTEALLKKADNVVASIEKMVLEAETLSLFTMSYTATEPKEVIDIVKEKLVKIGYKNIEISEQKDFFIISFRNPYRVQ